MDIFGRENFFIELQNHGIEEQQRILPQLIKLARENERRDWSATNDAHYINREDSAHPEHSGLHPDRTARWTSPAIWSFRPRSSISRSVEEMREAISRCARGL